MAWDCKTCGQHNVVEGYPCFRCGHKIDGSVPKKPNHIVHKAKYQVRGLLAVLTVVALSAGLAYVLVLQTGGKGQAKGTCAQVGTAGVQAGSLDQMLIPPPLDASSVHRVDLDQSQIAATAVNELDSRRQQERQRLNEITRLEASEFSAARQASWKQSGSKVTVRLVAFPTNGCADQYGKSERSSFSEAIDRRNGESVTVSDPGGALGAKYAYSSGPQTIVFFVKGAYGIFTVSANTDLAVSTARDQARAIP